MPYAVQFDVLMLVVFGLLLVSALVYKVGEIVGNAAERERRARRTLLRLAAQETQREEESWKAWESAVEQEPHAFKGYSL